MTVTNMFEDYCGEEFGTFSPAAEAAMKTAIDIVARQRDLTPEIVVSEVSHIQDVVWRSYPDSGASDSETRYRAWRYIIARADGLTFDALHDELFGNPASDDSDSSNAIRPVLTVVPPPKETA
jgi:hypothetical protein